MLQSLFIRLPSPKKGSVLWVVPQMNTSCVPHRLFNPLFFYPASWRHYFGQQRSVQK